MSFSFDQGFTHHCLLHFERLPQKEGLKRRRNASPGPAQRRFGMFRGLEDAQVQRPLRVDRARFGGLDFVVRAAARGAHSAARSSADFLAAHVFCVCLVARVCFYCGGRRVPQ